MDKFRSYLKENRGKAVRLAEHLGLAPSTISQWQRVPIEHAPKVCGFTGLTTFDLYPELEATAKDGSEAA